MYAIPKFPFSQKNPRNPLTEKTDQKSYRKIFFNEIRSSANFWFKLISKYWEFGIYRHR